MRTADTTTEPPRPDAGRVARAVAWVDRHPLLVVAALTSLVAVGHAVWIWTHRFDGAYDPDEAGYIASSLRMERHLAGLDPKAFLVAVGGTGNGVVVPLLSVPFALLGLRDPRAVLMAQPLLMVLTCVAVAGITRRLAGPRAAIAAGTLTATLPMVVTATLSYWFGLGAAACLAAAVWALLESDRCRNRRIWWFGIAMAAMTLSRTMTLGYVPALVVAGVLVAGRDRRSLTRLAASTGLGVALAAPWYLLNSSSTFGYLFSYGYGPRAARFGSGGVLERAGFRLGRLAEAIGSPTVTLLWASALCIAVLVGPQVIRRRGVASLRDGIAVGAALALGTAALVSTSNNGVWFELPMVTLTIALMVAIISAGPRWYSAGLTAVLVCVAVVGLGGHWWILPYDPARLPSHYEFGFAEYDERFSPQNRDQHRRAASEWDQLNRDVLDELRPAHPGDDDPVITLSGNMQLFNTNSLELAGELHGWVPLLRVPDTADPSATQEDELTPTADRDGRTVERIVVIAVHDRILFTPDADVAEFARRAAANGWRIDQRIAMPDGGEVQVLRHP